MAKQETDLDELLPAIQDVRPPQSPSSFRRLLLAVSSTGVGILGLLILVTVLSLMATSVETVARVVEERVLPIVNVGLVLVLVVDLFLLLPLSLVRRLRVATGHALVVSSYIFFLQLWLACLVITIHQQGKWWALAGLWFAGLGNILQAFISLGLERLWAEMAFQALTVVCIFGLHRLGTWIRSKA